MSSNIYELSSIDSVGSGDLFAIFDISNSDTRKVSMSTLLTYIQANNPSSEFTTQYDIPSNGDTVQVNDGDDNIHLILNHTSTIAGMTIKMPASSSVIDKQEVLVSSYSPVTALIVNGNGAGLSGEPTDLTLSTPFFRMKFDATASVWYRIG